MSHFYKTKDEIEVWLKFMSINNYTINNDLSVDVNGDVKLNGEMTNLGLVIPKIQDENIPIQFGEVSGDFDIRYNKIKSLKGSPYKVTGNFLIDYNDFLSSLDHAPIYIGGELMSFDFRNEEYEAYIKPLREYNEINKILSPKIKHKKQKNKKGRLL